MKNWLRHKAPSAIEVVSGATHSFDSFQNYAQQLIQAAQAGNTDTIEIDNGADLKDGTYSLEEKELFKWLPCSILNHCQRRQSV